MDVHELTFSDFYDLKALSENIGLNIAKNENGDQIKLTDIKIIEFKRGEEKYHYKVSYNGQWISAKLRTGRSHNIKKKDPQIKQAYTSKFVISGRKKDDLLKMINTNVIPKYYENFYTSLF